MTITKSEIECMHWPSDAKPLPKRTAPPLDEDNGHVEPAKTLPGATLRFLESMPVGEWRTMSEWARHAGILKQSANIHLSLLTETGLTERRSDRSNSVAFWRRR